MRKKYPDLRIVHFDAHADLRSDYLGVKLSHACVMRRCHEIIGDGRIFQFGIRSGDRAEFEWGAEHVCTTRFGFSGIENLAEKNRPRSRLLFHRFGRAGSIGFPRHGNPRSRRSQL